jgi:shikimate kinase
VVQEFCIINCDPSAVDNPDIRKLLNSEFVIFVNIDLQTQILRYKRGIMPLIHRESFDNMLMTLHQQRDEHHEALSNISLNTEKGSIEAHIDTILAQLGTDIQKQISHQQRHLFHKDSQTTVTLTDQQIHCLKGLAQGKSSKEIGRDLNISYRTVEGHITNLQNLLGCRNSKELVSLYNEHNH